MRVVAGQLPREVRVPRIQAQSVLLATSAHHTRGPRCARRLVAASTVAVGPLVVRTADAFDGQRLFVVEPTPRLRFIELRRRLEQGDQ